MCYRKNTSPHKSDNQDEFLASRLSPLLTLDLKKSISSSTELDYIISLVVVQA